MTATDELRRLLDERGVEWMWVEGFDGIRWQGNDGRIHGAKDSISFDGPTGKLDVYGLTPEQAIAATLRTGTCKAIPTGCATAICSECGAEYMGSIMTNEPPDYVKALVRCPNCGRKVVSA